MYVLPIYHFRNYIFAIHSAKIVLVNCSQTTVESPATRNLNILLVDDEETFLRKASAYLSHSGHIVTAEGNAEDVIAQYTRLSPDVVVLDVDLGHPRIDGRTLCATIANTERYQLGHVGIILISGRHINPGDELAGFSLGADNYLIKPFQLSQLSIRISALSRRLTHSVLTAEVKIGDLFLDLEKRKASVSGSPLQLTKLEFDTLAYLAKSPGVVRSKHDLLKHVWSNVHIEYGAVSKSISILRKKLMPTNANAYIKTVYGVGYQLIGED